MSGLWRKNPETPEGKYLVQRRDGTVPEWPSFVLGAADPAAPAALMAYADKAEFLGMDPQFVADIRELATQFCVWRGQNGEGDPDAPRHREDNPDVIEKMRQGGSA